MYGVLLLGQRNHQPLPQSLDQLNIEKQIVFYRNKLGGKYVGAN